MMHDVFHSRTNPAVGTPSDILEVVRILLVMPVADEERAAAVCNALLERPIVASVPGAERQGVGLHLYNLEIRCVDVIEVSLGDHAGLVPHVVWLPVARSLYRVAEL